MCVVPAKAGIYAQHHLDSTTRMGPRLRGDDTIFSISTQTTVDILDFER